jgi:branched-chain amino acid transport system ATP-binding protein
MSASQLVITGLIKRFGGVAAVDGVDLTIAAGEFHALIGSNGAGKTTLFNLLTGTLRPDAGAIRLDGRDIIGAPPFRLARLGVQRTFQINNLFRGATVRDNIRVPVIAKHKEQWKFLNVARLHHDEEIVKLADDVGLGDQLDRPSSHLSYGDQRRLELAIALAGNPRLLLLDEPTCGMPAFDRLHFVTFIKNIARQRALTAIVIEHDMDVVFSLADNITVFHRGRVLARGAPDSIRADPNVRQAYLGAAILA